MARLHISDEATEIRDYILGIMRSCTFNLEDEGGCTCGGSCKDKQRQALFQNGRTATGDICLSLRLSFRLSKQGL